MHRSGDRTGGKAAGMLTAGALAGLLALTGCSGSGSAGSSAGSQPSWAKELGAGVTVIPPGTASPGNDSPDAVAEGVITAVKTGKYVMACKYVPPSQRSTCESALGHVTSATTSDLIPVYKNISLGYAAIDGDKALVGDTGSICRPTHQPQCVTNKDPAAIFDSGKSFSALWSETIGASADAYSLAPEIKINGSWYGYGASSG